MDEAVSMKIASEGPFEVEDALLRQPYRCASARVVRAGTTRVRASRVVFQ